ncbi:MAG: ACT domain-containing protein [Oscillospiraceae bacterium]|nr:ACT domain-containing protein [Oscillospiraceae bacterium]MCI7499863.1 ACT domain-containing protein [Oscillospiraceae bacterium]MDD7279162.1 ACT domain-containing protein [Oscillospiraceae bacterium]MDY2863762.1 ACT domain-containing protein [Oscillospiraceae bacterium]
MKAVITVIGKDAVGILAKVSTICAETNANVIEVTQSVLQDMFAMIMLVDITKMTDDFVVLQDKLTALGDSLGLKIHTMHEDIFNSMHRI